MGIISFETMPAVLFSLMLYSTNKCQLQPESEPHILRGRQPFWKPSPFIDEYYCFNGGRRPQGPCQASLMPKSSPLEFHGIPWVFREFESKAALAGFEPACVPPFLSATVDCIQNQARRRRYRLSVLGLDLDGTRRHSAACVNDLASRRENAVSWLPRPSLLFRLPVRCAPY